MIREEEDEEQVIKTICITLQNGMNCATAAAASAEEEEQNYYYNIILDADLIQSVKIVLCAKRTRTDRVQQQQTDIYIYSWEWDRRRVSLICTKIVQRDASKTHTHSHRAIARHCTGGG